MRAATAKPPPPVPPRPSKTVIAEALAKTKKIVSENAPLRVAPPPPPVQRTSSSVNVVLQQKPQLDRSISEEVKPSTRTVVFQSSDMKCSSKVHVKNEDDNKKTNSEDDRNHVNTLIDEMFASVLEIPDEPITETVNSTVLVVEPEEDGSKSNSSTEERKRVKFDDKKNHELLISELESMKKEQQRIMKRQRKPSQEIYEEEPPEIHHSDWVEVNDGEEVRLSSCQITIDTTKKKNTDSTNGDIISRLSSMSSLHGLPPLPKSLSGFNLLQDEEAEHPLNGSDAATGKITSNLDAQLAILRREMVSVVCMLSILICDVIGQSPVG